MKAIASNEAQIQIVSGPEEGSIFKIVSPLVKLGRHSDNDIILKDLKASRSHAEILFDQGRYILKDLKSQNGVFLNNQRIVEAEIKSGDYFSIGSTVFKFVERIQPTAQSLVEIQGIEKSQKKFTWKEIGVVFMFIIITISFIKVYFSKSPTEIERAPTAVSREEPSIFTPPLPSEPKLDQETTDKNREEAEMLYHQGYREFFAGNYERAIGLFQGCLGLNPRHQLASIYLRRSFMKLDEEVERRYNIGVRFFSSLQYKEATREFQRVVEILNFYPESKKYQTYFFKTQELIKDIEKRQALLR